MIIIKNNNRNYKYNQSQVTSRDHVTGSQSNMQNAATGGNVRPFDNCAVHFQVKIIGCKPARTRYVLYNVRDRVYAAISRNTINVVLTLNTEK